MKQFDAELIAQFFGCVSQVAEYKSPIHRKQPVYHFEAVSQTCAVSLSVWPEQNSCAIVQTDSKGRQIANGSIRVDEFYTGYDFNQESGDEEPHLIGAGPGGHVCIVRSATGFEVQYCTYADQKQARLGTVLGCGEAVVPNATVARKIAEAILVEIYGKERIERQKPFSTRLSEGVWTLEGIYNPPHQPQGIALIRIREVDGQVLSLTHGEYP